MAYTGCVKKEKKKGGGCGDEGPVVLAAGDQLRERVRAGARARSGGRR